MEAGNFLARQVAGLTGLEGGEFEKTDADALEFLNEETEVLEHHADLVLASFGELYLVPGVGRAREDLESGGLGTDPEKGDAGAELLDLFFRQSAIGLDDVGFDDIGAFVHDGIGEVAIIGKQQEAFGVIIETADGVNALLDALEVVGDGGAALGVAHGGDDAVGLVHGEVEEMAGRVEEFAVDLDVIGGEVGFGAESGDGLAIDANAALEDHFLGVAAAGDAGLGDDFLKAFEGQLGGFRF